MLAQGNTNSYGKARRSVYMRAFRWLNKAAILFLALFLNFSNAPRASGIVLTSEEINWIGEKVFYNECASKDEWLIRWNEGEEFLSLGIGHFIWYPKGKRGPFEESFPEFLHYAKIAGAEVPAWLSSDSVLDCPWESRDDFILKQEDSRIPELREFLIATKPLQAKFLIKRFENVLPLMLQNATEVDRKRINRQFERLISTPSGIYALIDYRNFKGLGIFESEQYQGKGWGLLQVLSEMKDENEAPDALQEFIETANRILEERVDNSPLNRNEKKWLAGWQKRVNSYLQQ